MSFAFSNYFISKMKNSSGSISGDTEKISQDEIISNTKNVLRGLETLKSEHDGLLVKLSSKHRNGDHGGSQNRESQEKEDLIQKSLEKIELGIGEAQVTFKFIFLLYCMLYTLF